MRLLRRIEDWGLPSPVRQHRVRLPSGQVCLLDLAWPSSWVGLEYDGERWHTPRQLASDVARETGLRDLGWTVRRADRHDLGPSSTRLRSELGPLLLGRRAA
jgi:hypothetical protein